MRVAAELRCEAVRLRTRRGIAGRLELRLLHDGLATGGIDLISRTRVVQLVAIESCAVS